MIADDGIEEFGSGPSAFDFEPGFNTLPSGRWFAPGRIPFSTGFVVRADVRVNRDDYLQVRPISRETGTEIEIDVNYADWEPTAAALSGDSSEGLVARTWDPGSRLERLLPRFTRSHNELHVVSVESAEVLSADSLTMTVAAARYSQSGDTFALLGTDFDLWIFNAGERA